MPLRTPNDTQTLLLCLQSLATVMPNDKASGYTAANTVLGTVPGTILIDANSTLLKQLATFPALLLWEDEHENRRIDWQTWKREPCVIDGLYVNRWDQTVATNADGSPKTMDDQWKDIDLDLRRMEANIEDNPSLVISGVRGVDRIDRMQLSPYSVVEFDQTRTIFKVPVLTRRLKIYARLLPYISAS